MKTYWENWVRFWTAPADPTPLGAMRIVTGVLCLYVHAVYSFDLQEFFGRDAWYSLKDINKERSEYPWLVSPLRGKPSAEDQSNGAHVPMYPHRREAVMAFIRGLPADRAGRVEALAYVRRLQDTESYQQVLDGFTYLERLGSAGDARKARLDALVDEKLRTAVDFLPDCLRKLPAVGPDSRATARLEIERLLRYLPADLYQRKFVTDHLMELDFVNRKLFLEFLVSLPDDPAERAANIDYLEYWNTERGKTYHRGHPIFSIWFHVTDPTGMAVAHGVILGVIFLFTIGLCTRVTSVITWLAAVSYIHRTQHILFGMDTMMNLCLIFCMVGPCGAALSVDRLLNRYRAAKASLSRCGKIDAAAAAYLAGPPSTRMAGLALRMVQVQFCFIYAAGGLSKLKGPAWWNTGAFWDTVINPEFTLIQYEWYESVLRFVMSDRLVYQICSAIAVYGTLSLEIGLPFLVWTKLRPRMVIFAYLFHMSIAVFMGLVVFALYMMTLLLAYVPGAAYRRVLTPPTGPKRVLTFRGTNPDEQRAAALAVAFDFDRSLELADGPLGLTVGQKAVEKAATAAAVLAPAGPAAWVLRIPGLGGWAKGKLAP